MLITGPILANRQVKDEEPCLGYEVTVLGKFITIGYLNCIFSFHGRKDRRADSELVSGIGR